VRGELPGVLAWYRERLEAGGWVVRGEEGRLMASRPGYVAQVSYATYGAAGAERLIIDVRTEP
jgi:hypothetical protein